MDKGFYQGKGFWIIGASSGIGHATALELARRGARVVVSARNGVALNALVNEMEGTGHLALPFDVTDLATFRVAADKAQTTLGRIDGVLFLSALYQPGAIKDIKTEDLHAIIQTNLTASFYCADAVLPHMRQQKGGIFALCGSVAGYVGLPNGQPYSATKAGVINLAETLRLEETENGIDVRIINPGFVQTPLTEKNDFAMPMMLTPKQAAIAIADQLQTSAFEIHFPKGFTRILKVLRMLPYRLYFKIAKNFA